MEFPDNFDTALIKYEGKFLQIKKKKITLTKENFDEVMRRNFEFISFICFYNIIKDSFAEELEAFLKKLVREAYYAKFDKELTLTEMMTPGSYSYDLSNEPPFKTSILY